MTYNSTNAREEARDAMTTTVDWSDTDTIAEQIGIPVGEWVNNCHGISYRIMEKFAPEGRIARGFAIGVTSQHSWLVLGDDCFDLDATIIDPTLLCHDRVPDLRAGTPQVWVGTLRDGLHAPHGHLAGITMFEWGCPQPGNGPNVELTPTVPLSSDAKMWLDMFRRQVGLNLDRQFWSGLANHAPVLGWPAGEIIAAIADTREIAAVIPIDKLGMLTRRNPSGVYLVGRS